MEYPFYLMSGMIILRGERMVCADDAAARTEAGHRLADAASSYDAIEVWQGRRLVCRRERAARA